MVGEADLALLHDEVVHRQLKNNHRMADGSKKPLRRFLQPTSSDRKECDFGIVVHSIPLLDFQILD